MCFAWIYEPLTIHLVSAAADSGEGQSLPQFVPCVHQMCKLKCSLSNSCSDFCCTLHVLLDILTYNNRTLCRKMLSSILVIDTV